MTHRLGAFFSPKQVCDRSAPAGMLWAIWQDGDRDPSPGVPPFPSRSLFLPALGCCFVVAADLFWKYSDNNESAQRTLSVSEVVSQTDLCFEYFLPATFDLQCV